MWELDNKTGWLPKNWCLQTVVLEKILESHLDSKEIKLVNPKGSQSWIFTGRTDAKAEAPVFGHLMPRANSLENTLMLGKTKAGGEGDDRGWDGWMAAVGHEFEQTPGYCEGEGSLACCHPWGCKELDMSEWLNNTIFHCIYVPHLLYPFIC